MTASFIFQALRKIFCFYILTAFVLGSIPNAYCAKTDIPKNMPYEEVQILKGDIQSIPAKNLKRVSITDPMIADINEAQADIVDVIGIEPGQTILFVWDDTGKRTVIIRVVQEDMSLVKKRIQSLLESAGFKNITLKNNAYEGKVVVTGAVAEDKNELLTSILEPFSDRTINMVEKEKPEDLVQIDMQITEISTTLTKALGLDWVTGSQTAGTTESSTTASTSTSSELNLSAGEIIPDQTGKIGDIFKIGKFYRSQNSALLAKLNALISEGKAKVLSKPRLVVISGKEATFLVGGEVPIKTTTTNATGGSSQENVTFKEYGISLAVTPSIENGNMVNVLLSVEVSDIDGSKPTGTDIAFLTRSAHTQLLLEDRQTIVLAGMIKKRKSEVVSRVPFLSKIPVVGMLFRSTKTPSANEDMETVISITPTILRSSKHVNEAKEKAAESKQVVKAAAKVEAVKTALNTTVKPVMAPVVPPVASAVPVPTSSPKPTPVMDKATALSGSALADNKTDFSMYADAVQKKIASAIAYPYEAQEKGWQGTVKLGIIVQRDGMIKDIVVKESSGYPVFDQDAVNTAQILAPYAPFPSGSNANEVTLNIPIVYSLDAFLKNVSSSN